MVAGLREQEQRPCSGLLSALHFRAQSSRSFWSLAWFTAAPTRLLQNMGAEYCLHINILFKTPLLSPLWPWHNPTGISQEKTTNCHQPSGSRRAGHKAPKKQRGYYPGMAPLPAGLRLPLVYVMGFCAPRCLSQALCTCSLTAHWDRRGFVP